MGVSMDEEVGLLAGSLMVVKGEEGGGQDDGEGDTEGIESGVLTEPGFAVAVDVEVG